VSGKKKEKQYLNFIKEWMYADAFGTVGEAIYPA